jgi:hypothetical protein
MMAYGLQFTRVPKPSDMQPLETLKASFSSFSPHLLLPFPLSLSLSLPFLLFLSLLLDRKLTPTTISITLAKWAAWHAFEGLELLNNATGIEGLMGRSVAFSNDTAQVNPQDGWHNSSSHPGFAWLGDTSSDELSGHM